MRILYLNLYLYIFFADHSDQGEGGRAVGCATTATKANLWWETDVRLAPNPTVLLTQHSSRPDDKCAKDFNIAAGSVLHLVLALRGGF